MVDKKTEQITAKVTAELKRQCLEHTQKHDISESELISIALIHYFADFNTRGPVKMHAAAIGAMD